MGNTRTQRLLKSSGRAPDSMKRLLCLFSALYPSTNRSSQHCTKLLTWSQSTHHWWNAHKTSCVEDGEYQVKLSQIPLSNDTISDRIEDMSKDILAQGVADLISSPAKFSLQLDETTDNLSRLAVFVQRRVRWMRIWNWWGSVPPTRLRTNT